MIKFIIYDDEKEFRTKYENVILSIMAGRSENYETLSFEKYDSEFEKIILDNSTPKIYIMDIEVPKYKSGIDVSKKIRETDWNSTIILVTAHVELSYEVLKAQIMILDFISKYSNCELNLKQAIKKSLTKVGKKNVITFQTAGIQHRIFLDDILFIEKMPVDRKCIIKTTYSSFVVSKNLNEIINDVDSRFYQTHRSCIVNTDRISKIDSKELIIYFDNSESTNLLSRDKKKGLKQYASMV